LVKKSKPVRKEGRKHHYNLGAAFDKHIECEFEYQESHDKLPISFLSLWVFVMQQQLSVILNLHPLNL
jgi:hypothetical protein